MRKELERHPEEANADVRISSFAVRPRGNKAAI